MNGERARAQRHTNSDSPPTWTTGPWLQLTGRAVTQFPGWSYGGAPSRFFSATTWVWSWSISRCWR